MTRFHIYIFASFLLAVDQLTKYWVRSNMNEFETREFIANVFNLTYVKNTGMAFSLFTDHPLVLQSIVTIVVLFFIFYIYIKHNPPLYLAFLLGGGLGNLLDRYMFGFVTDFIDLSFVEFPVFNLADSFLNIGVALLLIGLLVQKKQPNE